MANRETERSRAFSWKYTAGPGQWSLPNRVYVPIDVSRIELGFFVVKQTQAQGRDCKLSDVPNTSSEQQDVEPQLVIAWLVSVSLNLHALNRTRKLDGKMWIERSDWHVSCQWVNPPSSRHRDERGTISPRESLVSGKV